MITVADARQWVGAGEDQDARLAMMIREATATLGRELGRYLGTPELKTEFHCGGPYPGHKAVFLHFDPLVGDDYPVVVSTRAQAFEAYEASETEDWLQEGREVHSRLGFPPGRGSVKVAYYTGYPAGQGPEELKDLVRQMISLKWNSQGVDGLMQSETLGDYSYTRGDVQALDGWGSVVNRWRRRLA